VSSPDESTHGVGLLSYEAIDGSCIDHNSFIISNYNGMEKSAKVGGYVAPSCAALVILLIFLECCNRAKWGGKCIPCILLLGAVICQGITFLIFNSELFCNNKDIIECNIGDGGYRSIQATLVYSFCFILYTFGPTPIPLFKNIQSKIHHQEERKGNKSGKKKKKKGKKKKKKLTEPGKGEEWTKEMYEARRKERKVKSRGVSGRRKEEIFDDMGMGVGDNSPKEFGENSMMLHDTDQQYQGREEKSGGRSRSGSKSRSSRGSSSRSSSRSKHKEPKYDEYVDTEPDGMDWSAFTPEQREEYYEQQRVKERKRKDRERRERDKMQQWEEDGLGNPYGGGGSDYSSRRREDEEMGDSRRGSGAYSVIDYENGSVRHNDSYYSRDSRAQDSYYSQDRGGERGYDDSYYSRGDDDGYDDRGRDDYQQDDYYEDEDLPPKNDSYYDDLPRSSSRQSRSASGRSRGSQYNDSYYSRDSYDRDSRYQDNL